MPAQPRFTKPSCTDEELLSLIQAGDHQLFEELISRYDREIYGYLRRYLGCEDLAADVFQNTFIAVFRKIKQYEPGRAAKPWLYTIATNQAIDTIRQRNRRLDRLHDSMIPFHDDVSRGEGRGLAELIYDQDLGPPAHAETEELRSMVRESVDQLPELLKQIILLAYFQGLRYQEIAEILDIPLGTVKSRLHAAVARLTEYWESTTRIQEYS